MSETGLLAKWHQWDEATDRDWANVLAELPLFADVRRRRLRELVRTADFAEFARGETVLSVGEPADFFYVILSGEAKAIGKPGARVLARGDYFGEMALLSDEPRSATVVATEPLHVMRVRRRAFLELLEQPGVAVKIMSELAARIRTAERQLS